MIACPACGTSVDPLRAPAVGIRDGKIVSYCSRECAAQGDARPTIVAEPPLKPSDPTSKLPDQTAGSGMIEGAGPAQLSSADADPSNSGIAISTARADAGGDRGVGSSPVTARLDQHRGGGGDPERISHFVPDGMIDVHRDVRDSSGGGKHQQPIGHAALAGHASADASSPSHPRRTARGSDRSAITTGASGSDPTPHSVGGIAAHTGRADGSDPPQRSLDGSAVALGTPRKRTHPGDPWKSPKGDTAGVGDSVSRLVEHASATETTRSPQKRQTEPPQRPAVGDRPERRHPTRALRIGAVALVFAACGGAFAAYTFGYFGSVRAAGVAPQSITTAERVVDAGHAEAAAPSATAAVGSAREVLRAALRSDSSRIGRIAASALARTGEKEALALLAGSIAKEPSDLAKVDIHYALARGGDSRGLDGLVAALGAGRRDVRLEAARRLALLGDKRAIGTLTQFLDVSQLRLGAAEQLAYLVEPRAIQILEAVRADSKATSDDKARAAIALGHAGRPEVAPTLQELLADARFNAFAAAALARLGNSASGAVRTLLVSQLSVPSLRVAAARSLRILEPGLDPAPLIGPLVPQLTSAKHGEQVAAAEAVLILAGPAAWSQRE